MTLYLALTAAVSGLNVNQQQIANISKNVTNANTEGYTRKILTQSASFIGNRVVGVQANNAERVVSDTLIRELRYQAGLQGYNTTKDSYFKLLQDMFGSPGGNTSLGNNLSQMSTSLQALAVNPQSSVLQKNTISDMLLVTQQLNRMSQQIQDIRSQADREIDRSVDTINTQLNIVADLNSRISSALTNNLSTADLEDQRDEALRKIGEYIDISTFTRSDGQAAVFLKNGGGALVDGGVYELSYTPSASLSASIAYPATIVPIYKEDSGGPIDVTTSFSSGKLAGLIEIRDDTGPALAAQLEVLATKMRDEMNEISNDGCAFPPPTSLTGKNGVANSLDFFGGHDYAGTAVFRVIDTSTGNLINSVSVDLSTLGGGSPGPATLAEVQAALDAGLGAGRVTASISSSGALTIATSGAYAGYGIDVTGGSMDLTSDISFSQFFGLKDLLVGTDNSAVAGDLASTITVNSTYVSNPALLPRGTATGVVNGSTVIAPGDSSTVQALFDKMNEALSYSAANGLPGINCSFGEYADLILAANANDASNISATLQGIDDVVQELNFRTGSVSGVNVDEEMANLIIYQNAYGASARIITIVNELFQELQNAMG